MTDNERAELAEWSKSPDDFWLVYRALMSAYDSSNRVAHMTQFADEVAAFAVSTLAAAGRLLTEDQRKKLAAYDRAVQLGVDRHAEVRYATQVTSADGTTTSRVEILPYREAS